MTNRDRVKRSRRWVVKIGSALLTDDGRGLDKNAMAAWVEQIAGLTKRGYEIVLVSSGAVAVGMNRLGWKSRPRAIHRQQAAAAVGQSGLIQAYEQAFQKYRINTAQVLLVHDDLSNRQRHLNARSTIRTLTSMGVIPIINENDSVVTDEIRFGDNDTLAAEVANLIEAGTLCILTDQKGMYDSDPRQNTLAKIILENPAADPSLDSMAGEGGVLGRGGMTTKVRAARLAERSGTDTIIVGGKIVDVISRVAAGEAVGTLLYAGQEPIAARKSWLTGAMQPQGVLGIDKGAKKALFECGESLLPLGVKKIVGSFTRGDLVSCRDEAGIEIARGLVNYSSDEARKIMGHPSSAIRTILGYKDCDELIYRDDLVLL